MHPLIVCRTQSRLIVYLFAIISQHYFASTNCLLLSFLCELSDRHTIPHCIDLFVTLDPDLLSTFLLLFFVLFLHLLIVWAIIYLLFVTSCLSTKLFASSSTSTKRSLPTPIQSRSQFTIALGATMGKSGNDEQGFSFAKLAGADDYKSHKSEHISRFHDSYIPLNKGKTPQRSATSSSDSKRTLSVSLKW